MKRLVLAWIGIVLVAALGLALAACDDEPHGACLYYVTGAVVCYENASGSCCQQIFGEFHAGNSCSKYPGTRVEPVSYSGCH